MTCREPRRADDRAATQLVQICLPDVQVCLHDDGSQPMMYDLQLRWPDGHIEAMEVTTATSAILRHLVHQLDLQGPVHADKSARNWAVYLAPGTTDVARVRSEIDALLSVLERAGLTRFGSPEARKSMAVRQLRRLGIQTGWSHEAASGQAQIILHTPQHWWRQQPEVVNRVVEDHAQRNAAKLARSGCVQRHLFVLFDLGELEAWSVLRDGDLPEESPHLPDAVTTVWAAGSQIDGRPVLWRAHRAGRWEVLL